MLRLGQAEGASRTFSTGIDIGIFLGLETGKGFVISRGESFKVAVV